MTPPPPPLGMTAGSLRADKGRKSRFTVVKVKLYGDNQTARGAGLLYVYIVVTESRNSGQ